MCPAALTRFFHRTGPLSRNLWLGLCLQLLSTQATAEDLVEFLSGAKLSGSVTSIRAADKEFDFETQIASKTIRKTYQFSDVHAVTLKGKRHVLTELPVLAPTPTGQHPERSQAEVQKLIAQAGAEFPDWYQSTPLNDPATLDLAWPLIPPKKGWNNKQNMGQYMWDIINPNPRRWRSGTKLVHQIMETHQDAPELLKRDQKAVGKMYFQLLQDYPRAAYWFEQAEVSGNSQLGVLLAECYWRLGNRDMAMEVLRQPSLPIGAIKLLSELGELETALQLAAAYKATSGEPEANLLAGDALRNAGRPDEAIQHYQIVLNSGEARNPEYKKRFCARAQDSIDAIGLADKADVTLVQDGTYQASSMGYNGPVHVEVTVSGSKIQRLEVVKHQEKQFYSSLEDTPKQIMLKQSVMGVDGFSGATITSAAIVNASAKALAQGAK